MLYVGYFDHCGWSQHHKDSFGKFNKHLPRGAWVPMGARVPILLANDDPIILPAQFTL